MIQHSRFGLATNSCNPTKDISYGHQLFLNLTIAPRGHQDNDVQVRADEPRDLVHD